MRSRFLSNRRITLKEFGKELGYWFAFGVVIALAQLWLIPFAGMLFNKPVRWADLIQNGSFLMYATTLTAKTVGDYHKKVHGEHGMATLLCWLVGTSIIMVGVLSYALVVVGPRIGVLATSSLSSEGVVRASGILAVASMAFSLAYTLYTCVHGDE